MIALSRVPLAMQLALRVRGHAARVRLASALHISAMPSPNRWTASSHGDVLWLGPEEFLLAQPGSDLIALPTFLATAIGPSDGAVVDVSSARVALELDESDAREVLASCCALDLHPSAFAEDHCAQTLIGQVPVVLQRLPGPSSFRILVRPSLEDYVTRWLQDAIVHPSWRVPPEGVE